MQSVSSTRSAFAGQNMAFRSSPAVPRACSIVSRQNVVSVVAAKSCDLTGVHRNKANNVSFSNKKSRKWQEPNLQEKKVFWEQVSFAAVLQPQTMHIPDMPNTAYPQHFD